MPETRLCPYRERGLECRTARADGVCRCATCLPRVTSHAFTPDASGHCETCEQSRKHDAHALPYGREIPYLPLRAPRVDPLCDACGMLDGVEAALVDNRPELALQRLRDVLAVLREELGPHLEARLAAYRERVAAQSARIDAHLNAEGRKQRKRR